ncbi:MAG: 50S ribosomal protein L22 [Candidatus Omnitrophica bacterium]|nr:50S ribosomal protein L22 [Candidatus Omnitrophota bacterium]
MIVKAENKHIKISPSKMREVMDLIRNKDVQEAEAILINLNKRPKESVIKVLRSAIANAKIKGFEPRQLYISKVICNVGPAWKRYKAAAFGRATPIKRRTSHIKIELDLKG